MQFIKIDRRDHVTTITLDRPEVMNAINQAMHQELQDAFDGYAADSEQHVCVVTGAGSRAFCAGSDLKEHAAMGSKRAYPKSGYAGLIERWDLDKPVIAAVNGLALGGGFEVALACDVIIASDTASFGLPEPLVGAVALGSGLHRLVRQIGLKPAMGLILSSRRGQRRRGHAARLCERSRAGGPVGRVGRSLVSRHLARLADVDPRVETGRHARSGRGEPGGRSAPSDHLSGVGRLAGEPRRARGPPRLR